MLFYFWVQKTRIFENELSDIYVFAAYFIVSWAFVVHLHGNIFWNFKGINHRKLHLSTLNETLNSKI